jgi:hypothetical protein
MTRVHFRSPQRLTRADAAQGGVTLGPEHGELGVILASACYDNQTLNNDKQEHLTLLTASSR